MTLGVQSVTPFDSVDPRVAQGRRDPLPVDAHLAEVRAALSRHRALILSAAPGAGKTTRVPPALAAEGPVILLQPRRVAARAIARRIAEERGWTVGDEIGWQMRFERQLSRDTRLLVVTEGILTARLQQDPLLSDFQTIVFDEFHERSIHADVALAMARQAWLARDDLRIVVMSATLDTARVAEFLDDCPVLSVPGRLHDISVEYAASEPLIDAVQSVATRHDGQILCFLPGAGEIARAQQDLSGIAARLGFEIVPLHGSLDADAQDDAIRPVSQRRVILATNIAETSLTVPGVRIVVDGGLHKVARYDHERGVDSLVTERITLDAADQRAGRAGRLGSGLVRRLWDERDRLRPHREPDIARIDLASAVLDVQSWGADPRTFEWLDAPEPARLDHALRLLERLGAIAPGLPRRSSDPERRAKVGVPTELGRLLQRIPLHPRLARILLEGRGAFEAAAACALLSESPSTRFARSGQAGPLRLNTGGVSATTSCDLLAHIDRWSSAPAHVKRVASELERLAAHALGARRASHISEEALGRALFSGYADRVAKRRAPGSDRLLLATGHGATLARDSGVREGEYLVALDVVAAERDGHREARVRLASRVEPEWLDATHSRVVHTLVNGEVRAARVDLFEEIVLRERPVPVDMEMASELIVRAWLARERTDAEQQLIARLRFAQHEPDLEATARRAASGLSRVDDVDIAGALDFAVRRDMERAAPAELKLPSGRSRKLEYRGDGSVNAAVKLQELFGLADSPRLGPAGTPVTFHLLAPNGQPVQTTRDLRSFWDRTYPEVRKALRSRYPRHPWPEDPWTAAPTHRTTKRR